MLMPFADSLQKSEVKRCYLPIGLVNKIFQILIAKVLRLLNLSIAYLLKVLRNGRWH
ncbi:hypothetical protein SMQC13_09900 [Serratia marcescens]|nr:hypothetical protein SMQC13_09900 [Serratia marcescens]